MATRVTIKGQVTLPKQVRDAAGISPGDSVEVRATASGAVIIEKAADDARRPDARPCKEQMTLVDTNVIVDVLTGDGEWLEWSADRLDRCRRSGRLYINETNYAELAVGIVRGSDFQEALAELSIELERAPTPALFVAGRAFSRYRAAGGPRISVLPDFFIGAHAHVARWPILTRDARRYRTYFPEVELIAPGA